MGSVWSESERQRELACLWIGAVDTRLFHSTICHCLSTAPTTFQSCYGTAVACEREHTPGLPDHEQRNSSGIFTFFSALCCVSPRAIANSGYLIPRCRFRRDFLLHLVPFVPGMLVPYFASLEGKSSPLLFTAVRLARSILPTIHPA